MTFLAGSGVSFENEWHPTRNVLFTPDKITLGSNKVVWWLGECGHEWEMSTGYRSKGFGCPVCVSLGFLYPDLASEWHPIKNGKSPFEFRANSGEKVWWLGKNCGHEWDMVIRNRVRDNQNCPICVNQRVLVGFNDLATTHPKLASEWHSSKNDITPFDVTYGSKRKVWWFREKCGHEWLASILPRASKDIGCGVCRGLQINQGSNDLATTHSYLVDEWHPTKNHKISVIDVTRGSNYVAWWQCSDGHEWEASVMERANGNGCTVCSNRKIVTGVNDFQTTHPNVAKEWNLVANKPYLPNQFSYGSNFKASWECNKNHVWKAKISDRCVKNSQCPQCSAGKQSSLAEKNIVIFLNEKNIKSELNIRKIIKGELDIYIPQKNIAIEFNGLYWHSEEKGKGKNYHYDKWKACKDKGIQLIQVWEDDWKQDPELIKRMLVTKLGVSTERKVFARKTIVEPLTQEQATGFLNMYHIQGAVDGGIRVGLFEDVQLPNVEPNLVAVMVLKREPGTEGKTLNLLRYATGANVVGGFTKLLKHVEREFKPESIVTFSDNTVSDGGLYENNGFVNVKELKPDYMYVVKGKRVHKFNYRLKRFREDPDLLFEEGLSERELALLNNLPRVWDAGKIKWEKKL